MIMMIWAKPMKTMFSRWSGPEGKLSLVFLFWIVARPRGTEDWGREDQGSQQSRFGLIPMGWVAIFKLWEGRLGLESNSKGPQLVSWGYRSHLSTCINLYFRSSCLQFYLTLSKIPKLCYVATCLPEVFPLKKYTKVLPQQKLLSLIESLKILLMILFYCLCNDTTVLFIF